MSDRDWLIAHSEELQKLDAAQRVIAGLSPEDRLAIRWLVRLALRDGYNCGAHEVLHEEPHRRRSAGAIADEMLWQYADRLPLSPNAA
jgi:hypothetical protein